MTRRILLTALAAFLLPLGVPAQEAPTKIVLFIGDGVGASYWTLARFARPELAVTRFRTMGLVDTRSFDSWITDSAAGATAYSTGVRTFNGAIGVGPDSSAVETVLEEAERRGWATGLVATSSVTHATPASFAAHVPSRYMEFDIAAGIARSGVDVLLGGGRQWFDGARRPDGEDLLGPLTEGATYVTTAQELQDVRADRTERLVGLFADNHLPSAPGRNPSLPELTRAALEVLDNHEDGFFVMIEGSQPDWRGHGNESLESVTLEMLDFDQAIGVALDYQEDHPETLVLVVADHETGGMAVHVESDSTVLETAAQELDEAAASMAFAAPKMNGAKLVELREALRAISTASAAFREASVGRGIGSVAVRYTTLDHTGQMVPIFAAGPGEERFAGIRDNFEVGRVLLELVRR